MGNNEDGFHMNINEDVRENAGRQVREEIIRRYFQ